MISSQFRAALSGVMSVAGAIAALCFALLALAVILDVLGRNLGLLSWPWLNEATEYLITIATFAGAPWLLHHSGHVNVDVLLRVMSRAAASVMIRISFVVGLIISIVLTWLAVETLLDSYSTGSLVFKTLVFPEWYLMLPMIWCFGLCCLEFLSKLLQTREAAS
jgi:TRAP-type C4-dicarboxylate transport system permease small subunit